MTLTINLFGGIAVTQNGNPLPKLISCKADILLAYLAQEQRSHSRESIATLFWDDQSQKQSLSNLRTLLSSLRKHAGDYLIITRKTIALNPEKEIWIDTAVFQQNLSLAQEIWPDKQAIIKMEEALALNQGEFLDGVHVRNSFELESWMQNTRDQLNHQAVEARQTLIDTYLQQGQYRAGIQHAAVLLQADSLNEAAHRQMMTLLARNGQRSAALEQYEACRRNLKEELGVEPEDETRVLAQRIELADTDAASNIPKPLTTFVGRTKERLQVGEILREGNTRLLTLIGLGGIGKTRLAIQIAHDVADQYLNGVYFVPLAPLESPDFLVSAIAEATYTTFTGNANPKTQLLNSLRDKEALLVLDNFEHLLTGVPLISEILTEAPGIHLMVTSRERLQLQAERLFELSGLACPTTDNGPEADFADYDSLQLFSERARLTDINFSLTENNLQSVVKICQLLEGMPLGIELAAAWSRAFSCDQILAQIEQNLDFLAAHTRDVPERHRSLRAVFDYVWELLTPDEHLLFVKLSFFRGGFDMEAATAVADVSPWTLLQLVEKSLLRKQENGRYEMLEVLRRFAAQMSQPLAAEIADARQKHAYYYAEFLTKQEPLLNGRSTKKAVNAITVELDNVHTAWSYAIEQTDFEIMTQSVPALALYYLHKGPIQEGLGLLEAATGQFETAVHALPQPSQVQANLLSKLYAAQSNLNDLDSNYDKAITAAKEAIRWGEIGQNIQNQAVGYRWWGWNCSRKGEFDDAIVYAQKGLEMAQTLADKHEEAACARVMSLALVRQGHYARGVEFAQHAYTLFRETGDRWGEAKSLNMLGISHWYLGEYDKAKAHYQQALPIYREIGNKEGENSILGNMGLVASYRGNYQEAIRHYKQILVSYRYAGNRWSESWTLNNLGSTSLDLYEFETAIAYCKEASRLAVETEGRWLEVNALHNCGSAYWYLGEYALADVYYQQTSVIQDEINETHGKGIILHDRSLLAGAQGDHQTAFTYAEQAVLIGESSNDTYTLATSLTSLGGSLAALKKWEEAEAAYCRALPMWVEMKQPHRAIDTRTGLLKIELTKGNMVKAVAFAHEILAQFSNHSIYGILSPFGAYLACVQALQAANDPRVDEVLREAQTRLQETAVKIQDPSLRNSYLQNVAAHQELLALTPNS